MCLVGSYPNSNLSAIFIFRMCSLNLKQIWSFLVKLSRSQSQWDRRTDGWTDAYFSYVPRPTSSAGLCERARSKHACSSVKIFWGGAGRDVFNCRWWCMSWKRMDVSFHIIIRQPHIRIGCIWIYVWKTSQLHHQILKLCAEIPVQTLRLAVKK